MLTRPTLLEDVDRLFSLDRDTIEDPYPVLKRMREEAPVLIHRNVASVTSFQAVEEGFRDGVRFSSRKSTGTRVQTAKDRDPELGDKVDEIMQFMGNWLIAQDAPDHVRQRGLMHRVFTPTALRQMREQVESITNELFDNVAEREVVDVVNDFAYELPLRVIGSMLGAPPEDRKQIRAWSTVFAKFVGSEYTNVDETFTMFREFRAYDRDLVATRRRAPNTDLLTALVTVERNGDHLTDLELEGNFLLLLFAGHETTTNLLSNGLRAFLTHPDQFELLKADPSRSTNAVEEVIRWDSPVQAITRRAAVTTELAGVEIPADTTLFLWCAGAGRDTSQFEEPDRFDIMREDIRHLGFGIGPHYCLGQALARMEGQVAFEILARRFPRVELAGPVRMRPNFLLRGPEALPVRLGSPA
jgi:cytochrome P450